MAVRTSFLDKLSLITEASASEQYIKNKRKETAIYFWIRHISQVAYFQNKCKDMDKKATNEGK